MHVYMKFTHAVLDYRKSKGGKAIEERVRQIITSIIPKLRQCVTRIFILRKNVGHSLCCKNFLFHVSMQRFLKNFKRTVPLSNHGSCFYFVGLLYQPRLFESNYPIKCLVTSMCYVHHQSQFWTHMVRQFCISDESKGAHEPRTLSL